MRSLAKLLIIWVTNCLDLSNLLGAISSANILLETSMAKTISKPSRLTVSSFVPILGFTSAIAKHAIANDNTMIFKMDLNTDLFGLNLFSNCLSANFFWALYLQK